MGGAVALFLQARNETTTVLQVAKSVLDFRQDRPLRNSRPAPDRRHHLARRQCNLVIGRQEPARVFGAAMQPNRRRETKKTRNWQGSKK